MYVLVVLSAEREHVTIAQIRVTMQAFPSVTLTLIQQRHASQYNTEIYSTAQHSTLHYTTVHCATTHCMALPFSAFLHTLSERKCHLRPSFPVFGPDPPRGRPPLLFVLDVPVEASPSNPHVRVHKGLVRVGRNTVHGE